MDSGYSSEELCENSGDENEMDDGDFNQIHHYISYFFSASGLLGDSNPHCYSIT
jgi:hypothetical protein